MVGVGGFRVFLGFLPVFGGVSCVIRYAADSVVWVGFEKRGECWVFQVSSSPICSREVLMLFHSGLALLRYA